MITRNFGLDFVRATAIALVLISHSRSLLPDFTNKILLANGGFFGVELFFALSGYLIGGVLLKTVNENDKLSSKVVLNFWLRRWFRTVPNYLLFIVLGVTLFSWLFDTKGFAGSYLFFLQNFYSPHPDFMPEAWSLSVEEWFYVSLPLLFVLFSTTSLKNKNWVLLSILSYILVFTSLRFFEVINNDPAWDKGVRKIVLYRLDAIGYGVLLAYINYYHHTLIRNRKNYMLIIGCLLIFISVTSFIDMVLNKNESFFHKTFLFSFISLGFALILPWFQNINVKPNTITKTIQHISLISYSMYLVHLSFSIPFVTKYFANTNPWIINYIFFWIITVLISTFIYRYYELPIMNIREKFK